VHVDTMETLGEFNAYSSESFVFVGISFDGVLSAISVTFDVVMVRVDIQPLVLLMFARTVR
jgi:hypothetical protein